MPRARGSMPRLTDPTRQAFLALVPDDEAVTTRPMFGQMVAYVGGTTFMGTMGDRLFLRAGEADRARVLEQGGADFGWKGYVSLPDGWMGRMDEVRDLVASAMRIGRSMPPKASRRR